MRRPICHHKRSVENLLHVEKGIWVIMDCGRIYSLQHVTRWDSWVLKWSQVDCNDCWKAGGGTIICAHCRGVQTRRSLRRHSRLCAMRRAWKQDWGA